MNPVKPRLKTLLLGGVGLSTPFLWYFDWVVWVWITAAVICTHRYFGWLLSPKISTGNTAKQADSASFVTAEHGSDPFQPVDVMPIGKWTENDEVRGWQLEFESLWKGKKVIEFTYRDMGRGSFSIIQAEVTEVIAPHFEKDEEIYFKGLTTTGEHRYFCVRYIKGHKVTDAETGDVGTLRKILGVKRRTYR